MLSNCCFLQCDGVLCDILYSFNLLSRNVPDIVSLEAIPSVLPISREFAPVSLPSQVERSQLSAIKTKICDVIACQPAVICRLADELGSSGLITVCVQQAVKYTDGKSPYEKADIMIGPVIERIHSDPRRFAPALTRALNEVGLEYVTTETDLIAAGKSS